jgi:hypothetical protein
MNKLWTFGDSFTFGHGCRPFINDINQKENLTFVKYINFLRPIWAEHVANKLNLELINLGVNGLTNDYILDNILNQITNFKTGDTIIIQISTSVRYEFPFIKKQKILGGWEVEGKYTIYDPKNKSPYFLNPIFSTNIVNDYENGGENVLLYSNNQTGGKNLKLTKQKYNTIKEFFGEFIVTKKYYERQVWRFIKLSNFLMTLGFDVYMIHEDYWPSTYDRPKNLISIGDDGLLQKIIKDKQTILHDTNGEIEDFHPSYDGHISIAESILKHINENTNLHNS